MATMFPELAEFLRRAQLAKGMQAIQQGKMQGSQPQPLSVPPPGPAESAYQQGLTQQAPKISDYHPSLGRKIGASILGGFAGIKNPAIGYETAQNVVNAPFNKQMTDYNANLDRLKEGSQTELGGGLKRAQTLEQQERAGAEQERKGAEHSRKELYQYQVEHPTIRGKSDYYNVTLHDGTKLVAHTGADGSLYDQDNNRIPGSTIANSEVQKPGTEKPDKVEYIPGTGQVIDVNKGTAKDVPGAVKTTPAAGSFDQKNQEWDRRNKVQFQQRLQVLRTELANGLKRLDESFKLRQNEPTSQTRSTAEFAKTVSSATPAILEQVDALKDKIGPGEGRWNQFWVNKGGANDPDFAGLDQDLQMYATALVRVHFGLRGGQALISQLHKDFSEAQSPEDLKARIEHADKWVEAYAQMHPSESGKGQETKPTQPTTPVNPKDPMGILGGK